LNASLGGSNLHPTQNTLINPTISQNHPNQSVNNNCNFNNLGGLGNMSNTHNNSIYDHLNYTNIMLSNWLGSVKINNNSLF